MSVEEFVHDFHNLVGTTVDEKKRSLYLLFARHPPDLDTAIQAIVPTNFLESLFHVEMLLRFHRIQELVEILRSGHEILIARILKNNRFCQQLSVLLEQIGAGEDIRTVHDNVLPFMSYVMRMRLIRKLGRFGRNLDRVFDGLFDRYGVPVAKHILIGCSPSKIRDCLNSYQITFTVSQQKIIINKFPDMLSFFVDERYFDGVAVHYLARKDSDLAFKVLMRGPDEDLHFGKKLTRKFLKNPENKARVIAKPILACCLHQKTLLRKTLNSSQIKAMFFNGFPSEIERLVPGHYNKHPRLYEFPIETLPDKKTRYQYFAEGIKRVYDQDIYDHPDLVTDELLIQMDTDERLKWVEIKERKTNEDFTKYRTTQESIPLILGKIESRCTNNYVYNIEYYLDLLKDLIETCCINRDFDSLSDVVIPFLIDKSESIQMFETLVYLIRDNCDMASFDEKHWTALFELMDQKSWNTDLEYMRACRFCWLKYLQVAFKKDGLTDELVLRFLRTINPSTYPVDIINYPNLYNQQFLKTLTVKCIDLVPLVMANEGLVEKYDLKFIEILGHWNRLYPKDKLSLFSHPRILKSFFKEVENAIANDNRVPMQVLRILICSKPTNEIEGELVRSVIALYFLEAAKYHDEVITLWLLKRNPELFSSNLSKVLERFDLTSNGHGRMICNYLRKYTWFQLPDRLINYCVNNIEEMRNRFESDEKEHDCMYNVLASLMTVDGYLRFLSVFANPPTSEDGPARANQVQTCKSVVKSFKFAQFPNKHIDVLTLLMRYFILMDHTPDSVALLWNAFYCLVHFCPENELWHLMTRMTTFDLKKKKYVTLYDKVGTYRCTLFLLRRILFERRHLKTSELYLSTTVFRFVLKYARLDFWILLKKMLLSMDKVNIIMRFFNLCTMTSINRTFYRDYLDTVAPYFLAHDLDTVKHCTIASINEREHKNLTLTFISNVMECIFLKIGSSESQHYSINSFVSRVLIHCEQKQEILNRIFEKLLNLQEGLDFSSPERRIAEQMILDFLDTLLKQFQSDEKNLEVSILFYERWVNTFPIEDTLKEALMIKFTILYLQSGKVNITLFTNKVADLFDDMAERFGLTIAPLFGSSLRESVRVFYRDILTEKYSARLFEVGLKLLNKGSLNCCTLLIYFLPPQGSHTVGSSKIHSEIMEGLNAQTDPRIRLMFKLYLREQTAVKNIEPEH